MTSLLSLTALRLKDRNVLIKRTDIIENLGVATIIASDKTGGLLQTILVLCLDPSRLQVQKLCLETSAKPCFVARLPAFSMQHKHLLLVCAGTLTQNKMSVENIYCNMELHKGGTFQPPPAAPQPSLDRASRLARQSLARRSNLGRPSQLGRTSRPVPSNLGRVSSSLARVSHDPATQMSVS